jgi:hypothetical protein
MTKEEVETATRAELQAYLENQGFAVFEKEHTEDLRIAVRLDIEVDLGDPLSGKSSCPKTTV